MADLLLPAVPVVLTGGWLRELSPIGKWNGQLILLPLTEAQKWMAYCRVCCKKDRGLSLVRSFDACLVTDYVPAM